MGCDSNGRSCWGQLWTDYSFFVIKMVIDINVIVAAFCITLLQGVRKHSQPAEVIQSYCAADIAR